MHAQMGEPTDLQRAQALLREARSAFAEMGATGFVAFADERIEALRADMHTRLQAHGKVSRELAVAGRIQEGLLPEEVPARRAGNWRQRWSRPARPRAISTILSPCPTAIWAWSLPTWRTRAPALPSIWR